MQNYKTLLISAGALLAFNTTVYLNSNVILADSQTEIVSVNTNKNLHASGIEFDNYLGNPVNSGILSLSKGSTVQLDYKIKSYGAGDLSLLSLEWGEVPGVIITSINNGDGTGSVFLTATEDINYSHPGILFKVTGAATPYSQRVMLKTVTSDKNENIPPVLTPKPEDPVVPEEPTNPDQPVNPEEPINPDQPAVPKESTNPDQPVSPEEPTNPDQLGIPVKTLIPNQVLNQGLNSVVQTNDSENQAKSNIFISKDNSTQIRRNESSVLPNTGSNTNSLLSTLFGVILTALGIVKIKKND